MRALPSLPRRVAGIACFGLLAAAAMPVSCATSHPADPASRFFAVHNTMRAMGLAEVGAVSQGSLGEGQEVRLPVQLGATCATFLALGGAGAKDLELSLLDQDGNVVGKDDTRDAEAAMRVCVDRPGPYTVLLRMGAGAGDYLVSSWTGGDRPLVVDGGGTELASGGTCDAPTALVLGQTYSGNTDDGRDDAEGSCGNAGGRELVYRLELPTRQRVTLDVTAQFDSVLYVRKSECSDDSTEIACNDDAPGGPKRSKVDAVFDPGVYYVFVDGYGEEAGAFRLHLSGQQAPSLADVCRGARPLASGARVTGKLEDGFDNVHSTCGRDAKGPDTAYRFELPARARVRVTESSSDFSPVVHLRRACEDEATEVGCSDTSDEASWVGMLDAGAYFVFADTSDETATGDYAVAIETAPESGGSAAGDACGDALPLTGHGGKVDGDTFEAKDDASVSCGAPGAPDVVYRIDLPHRSRLSARASSDESSPVLALERSCGDRSTEVACGASIDQALAPGTYFLVVDGEKGDSLGRFSLNYKIRDLQAIEAACANVPAIAVGRPVSGTTAGGTDKFALGCVRQTGQASADKVYRFTLQRRMAVRLSLTTRGFAGALALRKDCANDSSELKCDTGSDDAAAVVEATLEPGTYFAVVDGVGARAEGAFTLALEATR